MHKAVHVFYIGTQHISPEDVNAHMQLTADQFMNTSDDIIRYFIIDPTDSRTRIEVHYPTSKEVLEKLNHLISMHDVFDMIEL
tara:strand:- start:456 stop:704 length:249 start_codon:yes stop_codon:yes gene_type:complete